MGFLTKVLGGGVVEAAGGIATTIANYKSGKLDHKQAMAQLEAGEAALQIQVNLEAAANPSMFVSGGRPFILWTCGVGLAYQYVFAPIVNGLFDIDRFPSLDLATLMPLLLGLLGLGGMRTVEKLKGKARS